MTAKHTGGCICGQVRYEINSDAMMSGQCQCRHCQQRSGTGHVSFVVFPKAAMKLTGPIKYHAVKAESGNMSSLGFCPDCGSHITGGTTGFPDMQAIMVGSLDDPSTFAPQMVAFTKRGHSWDLLDPALPKFPAMPPMGG
jgi:hypothetical protein